MSNTERAEVEDRLEAARKHWIGRTLDYGEFERTVFDVEWDEARDRLILCARAEDEQGYIPEVASRWKDAD